MSNYQYTYLGAYFLAPIVTQVKPERIHVCSQGCGALRTQFCPHCGAPVKEEVREKTVTGPLRPNDFLDDDSLATYGGAEMCWLPNHRGYGMTLANKDGHFPITDQSREAALAKLKAGYKNVIDLVRAKFGVELEMHYGLVQYYA